MSARVRILRYLNRFFPPLEGGPKSCDQQTRYEEEKASVSIGRYLSEISKSDIDVLDFGCGWGGETIWLARRVRTAIGMDVDAESIRHASSLLASTGVDNCQFVTGEGGRIPIPDSSVDAVFSTDTFEHVMDLDLAFGEIYRVLRPGGRLITTFGPLFYSPLGYHLRWVSQVPWAHLLVGREALLRLRNEATGRNAIERDWQETGLNGKTFDAFRAAAANAGFQMDRFRPIPVRGLTFVAALPFVGRLFVFGIDCSISKRR